MLRSRCGRYAGQAFLERADYRARADHDLLHGLAGDDRRVRQLVRAAADRRALHGLSAHEKLQQFAYNGRVWVARGLGVFSSRSRSGGWLGLAVRKDSMAGKKDDTVDG